MQVIQHACVKLVQNTNRLVEQCALMLMFFRNDRGVRLLEHVRLLERIRY